METWPEFVKDEEIAESAPRGDNRGALTGWETVIFEVSDAPDEPLPQKIGFS